MRIQEHWAMKSFSKESIDYKIPGTFRHDEEILINNYNSCGQYKDNIHLLPYQAIVMKAGLTSLPSLE
jgi:hypothetical protein